MPAAAEQPYIGIARILGRNGSDSKLLIPDTQCLEAMNVDWFRSGFGRKRGGAAAIGMTGGTAFTSGVRSMYRHVPSTQTLAEFWALDGANQFHRLAGSAVWADPSVVDACTGLPDEAVFQSMNGVLYVAYQTGHNRLHLWDGATLSLRRAGLNLPATPATANSAGAVTDTRQYRIAWTKQAAGVTVTRSNLSVATAPVVMVAQRTTVTRPAAPGEGETHWELYGATSPYADYRLVATTILATLTADDNAALPATVAPSDGANTPPPAAKYMVSDDGRIIMAGSYEPASNPENAMAPSDHRVWWTSIVGSSGVGDSERVSNTGTINSYLDVEETITGLSQPLQVVSTASSSLERGSFYVFSYESQWKLVATGVATAPYSKFRITGGGGCIFHKSITTAIDENGQPAIYWASNVGLMRITAAGQEYLGEDIVDVWATINREATIPCHTVFIPDLHQVWFYIATGTSLYPNERVVFDTRLGRITGVVGVRGGWSRAQGESAKAYCSCLFSSTIGASMSRSLKPHIGYTVESTIWQCDTTDLDDGGFPFQGYVDTKSYVPWGLDRLGGTRDDILVVANPAPGICVQVTVYQNEGAYEAYGTADLTDHSDSGAATMVFARVSVRLADSFTFRCRVGDAQPTINTWNLQALIAPASYEGDA